MTPDEAHDFQQGWDHHKDGPCQLPTVVEEAEAVGEGCQAKEATPRPTCEHRCLKHEGHVEEGTPHFYGYILGPVPNVCGQCNGDGYVTVAEHDPSCRGDESRCLTTCPVPAQAVCPSCTESQRPVVTDEETPF